MPTKNSKVAEQEPPDEPEPTPEPEPKPDEMGMAALVGLTIDQRMDNLLKEHKAMGVR